MATQIEITPKKRGRPRKLTIEDMARIAANRGGMCLSETYVNSLSKLKWECNQGHQWDSTPRYIKIGNWCPTCSEEKRRELLLEEMVQIATSRGGMCLSETYVNSLSKLNWECSEGHQWDSTSSYIKRGTWCPICPKEKRRELTLEKMVQIATSRGGKCLSAKYAGTFTKLKWECREGHQWEAVPSSVKNGSWCRICSRNPKGTIDEMAEIAKARGGRCLSDTYINSQTKLQWECSEGHQWKTTPNKVKSGRWCPTCHNKTRGDFRKLSIDEMDQIAADRGGKCISRIYTNTQTKLLWECRIGHQWEAVPASVKKGTWCPECYKKKFQENLILYWA